jgi:signal transduction histidine kinase
VNLRLDTADTNRLFWRLQFAGWAGISLFSYLLALVNGRGWDSWKITLPVYAAGFVGTLGLRVLLRWWRGLPPLPLAAAIVLPAVAVGAAMSVALGLSWSLTCTDDCEPMKLSSWLGAMVGYTYLILAWAFLYITLRVYRALQQQTRQALEASAMAHQAQLKMLRYQLNPHFLFNTLNAISTLVLDNDPATANRMVQGLSAFLRYSLDNDPMQRVTLGQELEAAALYLDIEKLRFDERLRVVIDVPNSLRTALVPSLLLQPLIENAVKHAVAGRIEGGEIMISAHPQDASLCIRVADDGPGCGNAGPAPAGAGHGVGLANTRERLRVLYGERQRFEAGNRSTGGFQVELILPLERGHA